MSVYEYFCFVVTWTIVILYYHCNCVLDKIKVIFYIKPLNNISCCIIIVVSYSYIKYNNQILVKLWYFKLQIIFQHDFNLVELTVK